MARYVCAAHQKRHENGPCIYCEYDEVFAALKAARADNEERAKAIVLATDALKGARAFIELTNEELDSALTSNRIKTENNEALMALLRRTSEVLNESNNGELSELAFNRLMGELNAVLTP